MAGESMLLGVSVAEKCCIERVTDNFVGNSLVSKVMEDSVAVVEADMMT